MIYVHKQLIFQFVHDLSPSQLLKTILILLNCCNILMCKSSDFLTLKFLIKTLLEILLCTQCGPTIAMTKFFCSRDGRAVCSSMSITCFLTHTFVVLM